MDKLGQALGFRKHFCIVRVVRHWKQASLQGGWGPGPVSALNNML